MGPGAFMAPLYRQHVPSRLSELIGREDIVPSVRSIMVNRRLNGLLIAGPTGVGKTTLARIIMRWALCERPHGFEACLECEGCDSVPGPDQYSGDMYWQRGDNLTEETMRRLRTRGLCYAGPHIDHVGLVIDDLDLASPLLIRECISLLESFYTAAIIFTVTDQTRLPYPLLQRCQNISLSPLSLPKAEEMATAICRKEGLEIGDMQALKELAKKSEGNPRRILNAIEIVKGNTSVLTVEALRIEAVVSNLQSMTGFVTTVVEQDSI